MSKNFIAFDFGDGTTTAAAYEEGGLVETLNILPGVDEIVSALNYERTANGHFRPVIGSNAFLIEDGAGLRMNWKSRPTQMELTPGYLDEAKIADAKAFMQAVFREFCLTNPGKVTAESVIVIGVPSAWTQEDKAIYRGYAEEAGLKNVCVISESQAAYLYAQKFLKDQHGELLSDDAMKKGVLLIDVGSSTTDFTYAKGVRSFNYGIPLGAKYVDELLYKYGTSKSEVDQSALALVERPEHRDARLLVVYGCRERKERYFSTCGAEKRSVRIPERIETVVGAQGEELSFRVGNLDNGRAMDGRLWDDILDDQCDDQYQFALPVTGEVKSQSWREHFRDALEHVKSEFVSDVSDLSVVVTGGASRMYFIDEDVRTVFGDGIRLFVGDDKERSFSVVKGLAWAGYAVAEINKVREEMMQMLLSTNLFSMRASDMLFRIVNVARDALCDGWSHEVCQGNCDNQQAMRETVRKLVLDRLDVAELQRKLPEWAYLEYNKLLDDSSTTGKLSALYERFGRPEVRFVPERGDLIAPNVYLSLEGLPNLIDCWGWQPFGIAISVCATLFPEDSFLGGMARIAGRYRLLSDDVRSEVIGGVCGELGHVLDPLREALTRYFSENVRKARQLEFDSIMGGVASVERGGTCP